MKIFQGEELPQPKSMLLVSFVTWRSTSCLIIMVIDGYAVKQTKKSESAAKKKGEISRKSRMPFWYSCIFPTFVPLL